MNSMPHLLPSLPFCYQDGSFQVLLRNPESVAVFWDLPEKPDPEEKSDMRLCIHITPLENGQEDFGRHTETLILHHEAGHAFVPLAPGCDRYRFALGWEDGKEFCQLAVDEVEMPTRGGEMHPSALREAVEGCGFHPLAMA